MEIVFLVISIIVTILVVYGIGRLAYSHKGLMRVYKNSEFLVIYNIVMGMLFALVIFITLCAFNNTYWGLPYYF